MQKVVVLVSNDIHGDSRVQKIIETFVRANFDTYAIARKTKRQGIAIEGASITQVSLEKAQLERVGLTFNRDGSYRHREFAKRVGKNLRTSRQKHGISAKILIRYVVHFLRYSLGFIRGFKDDQKQPLTQSLSVDRLHNIEYAFTAELKAIAPEIIYANDYDTLGAAVLYADSTALRPVIIYDSHEYISGVKRGSGDEILVATQYQAKFISKIDGLVSVSHEVVNKIIEDYELNLPNVVILNAPELRQYECLSRTTIRDELGLNKKPLHVYVGAIAPQRGIDTVIEALQYVQDHHLAVVCQPDHPYIQTLRRIAKNCHVENRVHFVDYVPANYVSRYISDATSGLIPILHYPNHEMQLITKYFEYLHARLPIVTSDVREMARFTNVNGIGTVFEAENRVDCARALEQVDAQNENYRNRISNDLVEENSWENQAEKLIIFINMIRDAA